MTAGVDALPQIFRVLVLEDDPRHRDLAKESLEHKGPFAVDFASDLREADQHIHANRYDAVFVDVDLSSSEASGRQGDDWVYTRFAELKQSFVAIVTAQKAKLRHGEWLREQKIPVVEKGSDEIQLYAKLAERVHRGETVSRTTAQPTSVEAATMLATRTLSLFHDWIDSLPDGDVKDVWINGRMVSPADLKQEMIKDTPLGRSIASLFLDHARAALGLDREVNH